jgi:hypothetical protein
MRSPVTYLSLWLIVPAWVLLLVVMFGFAGWLAYDNHRFTSQGVHVTGQVLGKETRPYTDKHGNVSHEPVISYRYHAGNLVGTCTKIVREETWYDLATGGPIPIVYLPENPAHHRIDLPREIGQGYQARVMTLVLGIAVLGFGAWLIAWRSKRNRLFRRLVDQGARCRGEVLTLVPVQVFRGGTQTYLTFRFTTGAGEKIEARSGILAPNQVRAWHPGDLIDIWYDSARPQDFTIDLSRPHTPVLAC